MDTKQGIPGDQVNDDKTRSVRVSTAFFVAVKRLVDDAHFVSINAGITALGWQGIFYKLLGEVNWTSFRKAATSAIIEILKDVLANPDNIANEEIDIPDIIRELGALVATLEKVKEWQK